MKDQNSLTNRLYVLYLSFFGVGFAPKAPGTFGSLASIPLLLLFYYLKLNLITLIIIFIILLFAAIYIAESIQVKNKLHDPQWIVIDEVLGMFVTWMFVQSINPIHLIIVFITFRFFDIIKFWPATYFDKKIKHGAGTILDDIVSGIYAGILTYLIVNYVPHIAQ